MAWLTLINPELAAMLGTFETRDLRKNIQKNAIRRVRSNPYGRPAAGHEIGLLAVIQNENWS